ncbi:MAG: Transcriptional regulator, AcrR family [uncultured Thermomicrobiales bacterium]|uniref:Transcriptional regulator, AcrR family n=1 Tax=uncultured Thermomicrobiales bacterium TaxID=1645740 RepID=A0A6J4V5Y0_9BACT|nr:MAG: Transcriptional regulator, AcrR family [uncultured Thermomicrobiales bacterium]
MPSTSGWQPQRRAAALNEAAILKAADELLRSRGIDGADMREIAARAGVGIGTLYRRFGDKATLIAAVVGEQERALQDDLLRGPPPLGPGAPAAERLEAFLQALCRLTEANAEALAAGQATTRLGRYGFGSYQAWRLHATVLLREVSPDLDAEWLADLLLAPLTPALYYGQRERWGMSAERIQANLLQSTRRLLGLGSNR